MATRLSSGGYLLLTYEERRDIRSELDILKRVAMIRKSNGVDPRALVLPRDIDAIHQSFLDGATLDDLAARLWWQYDYAPIACVKVLGSYFESLQRQVAA